MYLVLSPGSHDKRVIDRDAKDLRDAFSFELFGLGNVAWQVGLGTPWCESSRDAKDDVLALGALLSKVLKDDTVCSISARL